MPANIQPAEATIISVQPSENKLQWEDNSQSEAISFAYHLSAGTTITPPKKPPPEANQTEVPLLSVQQTLITNAKHRASNNLNKEKRRQQKEHP